MEEHYPFSLMPLKYDYEALEPYIDAETVKIHHTKHHKTYVDNLNKALSNYPLYHSWSLTKLLKNLSLIPQSIRTAVKNNAGGVFSHNLYFSIMNKPSGKRPSGQLLEQIDRTFGSFEDFKDKFKAAALGQFGSGYAWLVTDTAGKLKIVPSPNQDVPLADNVYPIANIDVWEHAYYLKYKNRRDEYIDNWFNVADWDAILRNYNAARLIKH